MSLDNFQIPTTLLPELYKDSLIVLDDKQSIPEKLKEKKVHFLGDNLKNILILVNNVEILHLNDDDLRFLTGILTACKLTFSDVVIFNTASNLDYIYQQTIDHFKPKLILALGTINQKFNLPDYSDKYQPIQYQNIQLVFGSSLTEISKDVNEKKALWNCLKQIFGI
jgi:hypothetical protein